MMNTQFDNVDPNATAEHTTAVQINNPITVTVESLVETYATTFQLFATKTAENSLKMCKVVSQAKKNLGQIDFSKFCCEIGLREESSTIRKYLAIGDRYEQFIEYADRLPNSWTNIYLITQISADKFVEIIEGAVTLADATANDIHTLINNGQPKSKMIDKKHNRFLDEAALKVFFERNPTTVEWNTLKMGVKALIERSNLKIRFEWSDKFEKNHKIQLRSNERNAKEKRKHDKNLQKKIDQRNLYVHPLFDFGDMYDPELGDFVS
jgi:hypothetical protein